MTADQIIALLVLAAVVAALVWGKLRADVVALCGAAVLLATGDFCRTQMVRWGRNVYGTQFHPEITTPGMRIRIDAYGDAYYPAHEKAAVIARCDAADVEGGNRIITEFVRRYRS